MNISDCVEFHTSGSTGLAKTIVKTASSLDADAAMLLKSFPDLFGERPYVLTTIRQEHMFGALWRVRLPALAGCGVFPTAIVSVEELLAAAEGHDRVLLVTTPSFLENAFENGDFSVLRGSLTGIVTSGSLLRKELSARAEELTGVSPTEIFGSTETGSVAWRRQGISNEWTVFDGVDAYVAEGGLIGVDSPFSVERPFVMGDRAEFVSERSFVLLGRADRNVKILEKYVSLPGIEAGMEDHPFVAKAHAIASDGNVPRIHAIVELTVEGKEELKRTSYDGMTARLKREITGIERFAFPRRIRYLNAFPYNEQGKLTRADVAGILASRYQEPVVENETALENGFAADLTFIPDAVYFDGHFRDFKILPGVIQLDFIERCIRRRWRLPRFSGEIARLKFQRPVQPRETVKLEVAREGDDRFSFSLKCAGQTCTSGVYAYRKEVPARKGKTAAVAALLFSCLSLFSLSAGELPKKFAPALRRALDADASWTMTKTMVDFPIKLRAKGVVSCAKGRGVIWRAVNPIPAEISMTEDGMTLRSDGKLRAMKLAEMPYYRDIKTAVDGFLAGDDSQFAKLFEITPGGYSGRWRVDLKPKRKDMLSVVKNVSVWGSATIDKVVFRYASGETVVFEFKETARGAHSLWKGGK